MANAGYKAIFQLGPTTYTSVGGIKTAEISIGLDIYDITALTDGQWKKKLPGLADYTLKIGGNFDLSDAEQALLQASVITTPGQTVTWKLIPLGTGSAYGGTAIIKTQGVKIAVNAEQSVSWDLEGSGAITYA